MIADTEIVAAFRKLLARDPDAAEFNLYRPLDGEGDLFAALIDLPAYRNRFRDADRCEATARRSVALWPPRERPVDLQIIIASGDSWTKSRHIIERLLPSLSPRVRLTLICGEADAEPWPAIAHADLHEVAGSSVFEMRAHIPSVLVECAWVALVEDHATPAEGWVDAILATIASIDDDTLVFNGVATNNHSRSGWGWPNFLFNFAFHLYPSSATELSSTVTTAFFRRDLVGQRDFDIHGFEREILGRRGPVFNSIRVDHEQYTSWWTASVHVFDNGLVAGSSIRRLAPSGRVEVLGMAKGVMGPRLAAIGSVLAAHPERATFPRAIMAQLWWIGLCHSAGALIGAVVGSGNAHKRLE